MGRRWQGVVRGLGIGALCLLLGRAVEAAPTGWNWRQQVTVRHNQVWAPLTDYPLLLTEVNVDPDLFVRARADGADIVVTAADGSTVLKREVATYDPVAGKLELYVRIPLLSETVDTVLYVYYGKPAAVLADDPDTWNADYVLVTHMNDETALTVRDSTANGFVGQKSNVVGPTPQESASPSREVAGLVGRAQSFRKPQPLTGGGWIDFGARAEFNLRNALTVETLFLPQAEVYNSAVVAHDMRSSVRQWDAPILMDGDQVTLQLFGTGGLRKVQAGSPSYVGWNHVGLTYDATSDARVYLNGGRTIAPPVGPLVDAPATPLLIGTHYSYDWYNHPGFLGEVDEVRISRVARSEGWIQTERINLIIPGSFAFHGAPEAMDVTPPSITITTPANGARYVIGATVLADYACSDTGSGVASCTGPVADGAAIDTSTVGSRTFAVSAQDNAGNSATSTVTWSVAYDVRLRYTATAVKAGSAVPVTLQMVDASGNNLSSPSLQLLAVRLVKADMSQQRPVSAAGNANPGNLFRYDGSINGSGGYRFNLKTNGLSSGLWYVEFVAVGDTAVYRAPVRIK